MASLEYLSVVVKSRRGDNFSTRGTCAASFRATYVLVNAIPFPRGDIELQPLKSLAPYHTFQCLLLDQTIILMISNPPSSWIATAYCYLSKSLKSFLSAASLTTPSTLYIPNSLETKMGNSSKLKVLLLDKFERKEQTSCLFLDTSKAFDAKTRLQTYPDPLPPVT